MMSTPQKQNTKLAEAHDCVIHQTLQSWYMRFRVPKLFKYADEGKWDRIPARARRSRCREITFRLAYPPYDTALHRLARGTGEDATCQSLDEELMMGVCRLRLEAIEAILEVDTRCAAKQDMYGRTPLHISCQSVHETHGAAEALLRAFPKAAGVQDGAGRTPLHYLVLAGPSVEQDLIWDMVSACPQALEARDSDGCTPLELATKEDISSPEIIKCLVAAGKEAAVRRERPWTPP